MTISLRKFKKGPIREGHSSRSVGALRRDDQNTLQDSPFYEYTTFFFYLKVMSTVNRLPSNKVMSYKENKTSTDSQCIYEKTVQHLGREVPNIFRSSKYTALHFTWLRF